MIHLASRQPANEYEKEFRKRRKVEQESKRTEAQNMASHLIKIGSEIQLNLIQ